MQRYFLKQTKIIDGGFELSSEVAHHFVTVMRAQVGDLAEFVLDDGVEVVAQLIKVDGKRAWVQVDHEITTSSELPVNVTLACGVPKGEKAQLIVQKATELGVDKIIFFEAERSISRWHSDRRQKKIEKLFILGSPIKFTLWFKLIPCPSFPVVYCGLVEDATTVSHIP